MIEQDRQRESQIRSKKPEKVSVASTEQHPPHPAEGLRRVWMMTSTDEIGLH